MAPSANTQKGQPVASSSHVQLDTEDLAETKRKRGGKAKGTPQKRQKKTRTELGDGGAVAEESPVPKRGRRRDLSLLPTMPFDVIYEILTRLSLKDVVSVSQVNAEWCKLLCSKVSRPLWIDIRNKEKVPEPHPDMSELYWARFLFSGFKCEVCGTKGIQAPDFGIRRRACNKCKRKKLVRQTRLAKDYRQYPPAIADFLPETHFNGSWMHAQERQAVFFWLDDIQEVGQKWNQLQLDIRNRVPGAQDRAMAYKARREEIVIAIQDRLPSLMQWYQQTIVDRSNAKIYASVRRKEEIFKRFREMGYTDADLRCIESSMAVDQNRDLTERIWKNIKPKLEEEIRPRRRTRLIREGNLLLVSAYDAYMKQLKPIERITIATLEELLSFPDFDPFDNLAVAPGDLHSNATAIGQIRALLPGVIADWQQKFKEKLQTRIHYDSVSLTGSPSYTQLPRADPSILNLAVSAATCVNFSCMENPNGAILGWDVAMYHRSCSHRSSGRPAGNPVATNLVRLVGHDPKTATIDDMDQDGHLFLCSTCVNNTRDGMVNVGRKLHGAVVYTWRQAISHALIERLHPNHSRFEKLDQEYVPHVLESHASGPAFAKRWSCNHCAGHYDNYATLNEVKLHPETVHDIHKPTFPDDFFAMPLARSWPLGFTLRLWVDDVPAPSGSIAYGRFLCDHCSHCAFDVDDIRKHIADSHDGASLDAFRRRKYWQGWMPPPHLEYPT